MLSIKKAVVGVLVGLSMMAAIPAAEAQVAFSIIGNSGYHCEPRAQVQYVNGAGSFYVASGYAPIVRSSVVRAVPAWRYRDHWYNDQYRYGYPYRYRYGYGYGHHHDSDRHDRHFYR